MKSIKLITAGLAVSGLYVTSAVAQSAMFAGMAPLAKPQSPIVKTQSSRRAGRSGQRSGPSRLPLGMSANLVRDKLARDGFREISVTFLGITAAHADACKQGVRYKIKLRSDGSYEYRNEDGRCRKSITPSDAGGILRRRGYQEIVVHNVGRVPYTATACRGGSRYKIRVSEYGDVDAGERTGDCSSGRDTMTAANLRRSMRKDGYSRLKFIERKRRRFVVEACDSNNRRMRLSVNRRNRARDTRRVGQCSPLIRINDVPETLRREGFNRIRIVKNTKPVYRVEACDGRDNLIRISIGTWGERIGQRQIGKCEPRATVASLRDMLRSSNKFRGISVREGRRYPFIAQVCDQNGQRLELHFMRHGRFGSAKELGRCESRRVSDIINQLRDRGFRNPQIFVEGCRHSRRGRRMVRLTFDEFGYRVGREELGRCR